MKIGATFPNDGVGSDPIAVRDFAQAIEGMGFDHLCIYDHVLGASEAHYSKERLPGPYREHDLFNEPFVLFGYLAGLTKRLEFATTILILPQRQTVMVAKQAAQVDVLTGGGRLRLGVGSGWNPVEYEGLGMPWNKRGRMMEEQIKVLRQLWTQEIVDFKGEFHTIDHAGINPLPVTRPIPIWLGGISPAVIDRTGRLGDGWIPMWIRDEPGSKAPPRPPIDPVEAVAQVRQIAADHGRDPKSLGLECRIVYKGTPDDWRDRLERYKALGTTHLTLNTPTAKDILKTPDQHLAAIRRMKEELGL